MFLVLDSFIKNLFITKSRECKSDLVNGYASIYEHFFRWTILTSKVGQSDIFLVCGRGSLVGLQDYKSLCATITICATTVDRSLIFIS